MEPQKSYSEPKITKDPHCLGSCPAAKAECGEVLQASGVPGIAAGQVGSGWLLPRLGESGGHLNEVYDLELGLNPQNFSFY